MPNSVRSARASQDLDFPPCDPLSFPLSPICYLSFTPSYLKFLPNVDDLFPRAEMVSSRATGHVRRSLLSAPGRAGLEQLPATGGKVLQLEDGDPTG